MLDWAEVRRLHQVERLSKAAIAARLGDEPQHGDAAVVAGRTAEV